MSLRARAGATEHPFIPARAQRRPSDLIRRLARVGSRSGRYRPAGEAAFPSQAQVVGPRAREKRRFGQMGQAEIGWAKNELFGPNF